MRINWYPRNDELASFVDEYVDSFASWDLLLFFHFNSDTSGTAESLAGRLGRPVDEIAAALDRFCRHGWVRLSGGQVYRLDLNDEVRQDLARFALAQDNRELRLQLIRSILAKNRE